MKSIKDRCPKARIVAIGCSLGGNKLGLALGQDGADTLIEAAVCI